MEVAQPPALHGGPMMEVQYPIHYGSPMMEVQYPAQHRSPTMEVQYPAQYEAASTLTSQHYVSSISSCRESSGPSSSDYREGHHSYYQRRLTDSTTQTPEEEMFRKDFILNVSVKVGLKDLRYKKNLKIFKTYTEEN